MGDKIRVLRGADRVRLRPAVFFDSNDLEGVKTAVEMMLGVMTAECGAGYSDRVEITLHDDSSVEIEDFGRGIYLGGNPEEGWKDIFCELFAGSRDGSEFLSSKFSLFEKEGSGKSEFRFGHYDEMTLCAIQYAAEYMNVRIRRERHELQLNFAKGENIGGLTVTPYEGRSGTKICFKLDPAVFSDVCVPFEYLAKQAQKIALTMPSVKAVLNTDDSDTEPIVFFYPNGIADYLQHGSEPCITTPVFCSGLAAEGQERYNRRRYAAELQIGIAITQGIPKREYYHNGRELTSGGTHVQAILGQVKKYIEWMLEKQIDDEEIEKHVSVIAVTRVSRNATRWANGERTAIENVVLKDMAMDSLGDAFGKFLKDNRDVIEAVF